MLQASSKIKFLPKFHLLLWDGFLTATLYGVIPGLRYIIAEQIFLDVVMPTAKYETQCRFHC